MSPDDFGRLFTTFRRTAFRLETLRAYNIPEEAESLRLWREGKPRPAWQREREWLRTVATATAAGKFIQRVRVVRQPLSDYVRLEFDWGYPDNVASGEDIRVLELADGDRIPGMLDHDDWLFDDVVAVRMEYTEDGAFIRRAEVLDVVPYRRCRDVAVVRAVPFSQYRAHTT
jgi:hypothetical protein